jgi:hypothetical protein
MGSRPSCVVPGYGSGTNCRTARDEGDSGGRPPISLQKRARAATVVVAGVLAAALPLIGLVSLLLRSQLDPHLENYGLHFVVFGIAGSVAFVLGYAAGEAASWRSSSATA